MLPPPIGYKTRGPPQWRVIVTRITEHRWIEIDQGDRPREKEHPLEAMLHWRDPAKRLRNPCRRRSLLDDNPSSG